MANVLDDSHPTGEQYGTPFSVALYQHRLGRTGRAGKAGRGLLVVLPFEARFVSKRKITRNPLSLSKEAEDKVEVVRNLVQSRHPVLKPSAEAACKSFVAHYREYSVDGLSEHDLNGIAGELAHSFGLADALSCRATPLRNEIAGALETNT